MRKLTVMFAAVIGVLLGQAALADSSGIPTNPPEVVTPRQAVNSAKAWLDLVDDGDATQSWNQSDPYFQAHVSLAQWTDAVKTVRGTFGHVVARTFYFGVPTSSLSGTPAGQYLVLRFYMSATKRRAKETVTLAWHDDGWKVVGFYISGPDGVYVSGVGALPMH